MGELNSRQINVPVGEYRVTANTGEKLHIVTGSCVGLALFEPEKRVLGIVHIVLPGRRSLRREGDSNAYFADTGVPLLIEEMKKKGAQTERLEATIIGGSKLITGEDGMDIGLENIKKVIMLLKKSRIPVVKKFVGGRTGWVMTFDVFSGKVNIRPTTKEPSPGVLKDNEKINEGQLKGLLLLLEGLRPDPELSGSLLDELHGRPVNWEMVQNLISSDFVLSTNIFRLINSPYYGQPGGMPTFDSALNNLGARQLRRLCVLAASKRNTKPARDIPSRFKKKVSRRSSIVSVAGGVLARSMLPHLEGHASTAGLLHAVGTVAGLLLLLSDDKKQDKGRGEKPAPAGDAQDGCVKLGVNCDELARFILSQWKIPDEICTAVASCRAPGLDSDGPVDLAAVVQTACWIGRLLGPGMMFPFPRFEISQEIYNKMDLKNTLNGIVNQVFELLKSQNMMEIKPPDEFLKNYNNV